jgi:hypothetical protein
MSNRRGRSKKVNTDPDQNELVFLSSFVGFSEIHSIIGVAPLALCHFDHTDTGRPYAVMSNINPGHVPQQAQTARGRPVSAQWSSGKSEVDHGNDV